MIIIHSAFRRHSVEYATTIVQSDRKHRRYILCPVAKNYPTTFSLSAAFSESISISIPLSLIVPLKKARREGAFLSAALLFLRDHYNDVLQRSKSKKRERVPLGAHYIAQVDRFHSHFTFELCLPDVSFFFLCWDRLLWPMAYGIVCSSFRNNFRWPLGIESLALSLVEYRRFLLTQSFLGRIYFMVFGAKKRRRKKCD